LSHIADDAYNKLRKNIGNDFGGGQKEGRTITELYSFHCGSCGYRNIHDIKTLACGCGKGLLRGTLVYRKIGDTVVYDAREKRKGNRR
jgi:hypothetical protein